MQSDRLGPGGAPVAALKARKRGVSCGGFEAVVVGFFGLLFAAAEDEGFGDLGF